VHSKATPNITSTFFFCITFRAIASFRHPTLPRFYRHYLLVTPAIAVESPLFEGHDRLTMVRNRRPSGSGSATVMSDQTNFLLVAM
jgi:hypothetical protein